MLPGEVFFSPESTAPFSFLLWETRQTNQPSFHPLSSKWSSHWQTRPCSLTNKTRVFFQVWLNELSTHQAVRRNCWDHSRHWRSATVRARKHRSPPESLSPLTTSARDATATHTPSSPRENSVVSVSLSWLGLIDCQLKWKNDWFMPPEICSFSCLWSLWMFKLEALILRVEIGSQSLTVWQLMSADWRVIHGKLILRMWFRNGGASHCFCLSFSLRKKKNHNQMKTNHDVIAYRYPCVVLFYFVHN